jgi:hypothetical protein
MNATRRSCRPFRAGRWWAGSYPGVSPRAITCHPFGAGWWAGSYPGVSPAGITGMSRRTVEKFAKRVAQLYEQGADSVGIGQYVRRWVRWTTAGLDGRVRWKETGYPVGCESVLGRFLPDLLSLRDTGDLWSWPSIIHVTPSRLAPSADGNEPGGCLWL